MKLWVTLGVVFTITFGGAGHASVGIDHQAELQQLEKIQADLNTQKQWLTYRYEAANNQCYGRFWMQNCMDRARVEYLQATKVVRDQEVALLERQRAVNEIIKDEKDQQRFAQYLEPEKVLERAQNRANYEQKQRQRIERQEQLEERRKDAQQRAADNRKTSPLD